MLERSVGEGPLQFMKFKIYSLPAEGLLMVFEHRSENIEEF